MPPKSAKERRAENQASTQGNARRSAKGKTASKTKSPDTSTTEQHVQSGGLDEESVRATTPKPEQEPNDDQKVTSVTTSLKGPGKPIQCERHGPTAAPPAGFIFTHGASGTINSPATRSFAVGASAAGLSTICFQGSMNLNSRVKDFHVVMSNELSHTEGMPVPYIALGGRSMGARAAVMAAAENTAVLVTHLVLVSYPLVGANGSIRDELLLDIDPRFKVLFISGDRDNMCDINELNKVRQKMKAQSWCVVVRDADHGMSVKPKSATDVMTEHTGQIAAKWVQGEGSSDEHNTESALVWDRAEGCVVQSEWEPVLARSKTGDGDKREEKAPTPKPKSKKTTKAQAVKSETETATTSKPKVKRKTKAQAAKTETEIATTSKPKAQTRTKAQEVKSEADTPQKPRPKAKTKTATQAATSESTKQAQHDTDNQYTGSLRRSTRTRKRRSAADNDEESTPLDEAAEVSRPSKRPRKR